MNATEDGVEPMGESPDVPARHNSRVGEVLHSIERGAVLGLLQECGISTGKDGRAAGLAWLSAEARRELTTSKDLTREEASTVIQVLEHEKTQRAQSSTTATESEN